MVRDPDVSFHLGPWTVASQWTLVPPPRLHGSPSTARLSLEEKNTRQPPWRDHVDEEVEPIISLACGLWILFILILAGPESSGSPPKD